MYLLLHFAKYLYNDKIDSEWNVKKIASFQKNPLEKFLFVLARINVLFGIFHKNNKRTVPNKTCPGQKNEKL